MPDFTTVTHAGLDYLTASTIHTRHAFTTRRGGCSTGIWESLNLGTHRGDDPAHVRENYARLGRATGIHTEHMAFTHQVHGNVVRTVGHDDVHTLYTDMPYEADGIVTAESGLALICFTADCVPVLLCDAPHHVIGAVHCGWRSSVADILGVAVQAMCALGATPATIGAAIGPAIGRCCFEVGPEVVDAARAYVSQTSMDAYIDPVPGAPDKAYLDLRAINRLRLLQLGLLPEHIAVSDACTKCSHTLFWSHRYTHGQRGAQGALIELA